MKKIEEIRYMSDSDFLSNTFSTKELTTNKLQSGETVEDMYGDFSDEDTTFFEVKVIRRIRLKKNTKLSIIEVK